MPSTRQQQSGGNGGGANLADILERVLDKGIVIAGDVQINLLDIELLTIKLRLVVASVDRAKEMGIDWWERDPTLSSGHQDLLEENQRLRERVEVLETREPREIATEDHDDGTDDDELDDDTDDDTDDELDPDDHDTGDEDQDDEDQENPADDEPEPEPVRPRRPRRSRASERERRGRS